MRKSAQKLISTVLTICLLITIFPARAFASEVEQEVPAPAAESSTPIITLKNYDGSATLTTIETTAGTVFTQAALSAEVDLLDAVRGGYKFVGWSTTAGEVTSSYVPTESFTVNESMTLYAVHRPLVASDVNATIGSTYLTNLCSFDEAVSEYGFSAEELSEATVRDDGYYDSIDAYLDGILAETPVAVAASTTAPSIDAQRFSHAYSDAVWSMNQRSDLSFPKEVVYMFTSHYIDVAEPLSGTTIGHDQSLYQLYITDLDRRTYETYYQNSSHVTWYNAMFDFVSALADVPDAIDGISESLSYKTTKLATLTYNLNSLFSDFETIPTAVNDLISDSYQQINEMTYTNEADLYSLLNALTDEVAENLSVDYADIAESAANSIIGIALVMTGSTLTLGSVMGMSGFYIDLFFTLMDSAYYVNMRAYIQTRVGERMMYALGMSDGRN